MTEEEAKTSWCPFARQPSIAEGRQASPVNRMRDGRARPGSNCLGSACMAWRWGSGRLATDKDAAIRAHIAKFGSSLRTATAAAEAGWEEHPTEGYCGLAGQP